MTDITNRPLYIHPSRASVIARDLGAHDAIQIVAEMPRFDGWEEMRDRIIASVNLLNDEEMYKRFPMIMGNVWKDIFIAPRDGTRILLFCDRVHNKIYTGYWFDHRKEVDGKLAFKYDGWWLDGFDHPFNQEPFMPTLWQPLILPVCHA